MKLIVMLIAGLFAGSVFSQDLPEQPVPQFEKIKIENTGISVYMPKTAEPLVFTPLFSEDSALVYTGETNVGDFNFGVIAVEFSNGGMEMTYGEKEELLISYMDYLQSTLGITATVGYGKGHSLESLPDVVGVLDYWEDDEANEWVVKGWVNNQIMVVFVLYGPGQYPYLNAEELFLNGLRLNE